MGRIPDPNDHGIGSTESVQQRFYNDRLDRDGLTRTEWPARIDQAALDLLYGVSIGLSDTDAGGGGVGLPGGGSIGKFDFGRATGGYYREGLVAFSGDQSDLPAVIGEYEDERIGDLAFRFNELHHKLREEDGVSDLSQLDRALEAVVEKVIARSIHRAESAGTPSLETPESVTELMQQIFSRPSTTGYADLLLEQFDERRTGRDLLRILDAPEMVTPLWDHQRDAISEWVAHGCKGYVDMATATGKTVLGLAAIAVRYGRLHPADDREIEVPATESGVDNGRVLIVAGQELLLEQWRSEFDEHLDIPRSRSTRGDAQEIQLDWGVIEFRTAQELRAGENVGAYDLVILDEAHRYGRGSRSGRGWRTVLEELVSSSDSILAMSGSIDQGWLGDDTARNALEEQLPLCKEFSVGEARKRGVIADFSWEVRYTAADDSPAVDALVENTEPLSAVYDERRHEFDVADRTEALPADSPTQFETLTGLRSFVQSELGVGARERSDSFDEIATAALSRRPQRWQLSPPPSVVADVVTDHAPEQKVVVLVQSYNQAETVGEEIEARIGDELVLVPDARSDDQYDVIRNYREGEYQVIVGPGDLLGVGVDLPDADVAINLGKGGVNASLIQRIGRVLRNPDGEKDAQFYHVITLASAQDAVLFGEDGRRLVRRACEFRALGRRLRELPGYSSSDDAIENFIYKLEETGVAAIRADNRATDEMLTDEVAIEYLSELVERIETADSGRFSVLFDGWDAETLARDREPIKDSVQQDEATSPKVDDRRNAVESAIENLDGNDQLTDSDSPRTTTESDRSTEQPSIRDSVDDTPSRDDTTGDSPAGSRPLDSEGTDDGTETQASESDSIFGRILRKLRSYSRVWK